jgi:hypothetical protein
MLVDTQFAQVHTVAVIRGRSDVISTLNNTALYRPLAVQLEAAQGRQACTFDLTPVVVHLSNMPSCLTTTICLPLVGRFGGRRASAPSREYQSSASLFRLQYQLVDQ